MQSNSQYSQYKHICSYMDFLREIVSGPKHRYRQNGYNLDLTYVTNRIIAMAFPASGFEKLYRNSIDDVVQFLRERHKGSHWIINISGRSIDQTKLNNTDSYDWEDHCAPPMETLFIICDKMYNYLSQNENNIIAVHCNQGKGRTGTIICCFFMFCNNLVNPKDAMTYYARKRFEVEGLGVTQPCQVRYISYFHSLMFGPKRSPSVVAITKMVLIGKSKLNSPYIKVKRLKNSELLFTTKYSSLMLDPGKDVTVITPSNLVYFCGDAFIILKNYGLIVKKIGRISFNTAFIPENNILTLQIAEISPDSLRKSCIFESGFKIMIYFKSICECPNNISIQQRCKSCRSKLGSEEENWNQIYNIIEKQPPEKRQQQSQKILFGSQTGQDMLQILVNNDLKQ